MVPEREVETDTQQRGGGESFDAAPPKLEAALAELEALVAQLESGELPLDEALRTFEQGVKLTRDCQAVLAAAEHRVQVLLQRGERVVIEEFSGDQLEP
jgi:exodeoxyribonuclease VII small subunit